MFILFLIVFIDLVGFGIIIPLLPFYAESFSASPSQVTWLMAAFSLAQFVAAPLWGAASDRLGRKPLLAVSLAGLVLCYIGIAFVESFAQLLILRALAGAMSGNLSIAQAAIADLTTPETRAKGMGLFGAAFGLGFIVGPFIGGILAGSDPTAPVFAAPAYAAALTSAIALILVIVILPEPYPAEKRQAQAATQQKRSGRLSGLATALGTPGLGLLVALMFVVTFVFAGMEATFALWAGRTFSWGPQQIGYVFAYAGVIAAIVQGGLIGRLTPRFGEKRLATIGSISLCVGMALVAVSISLPILVLAMTLLAAGLGLVNPSLHSLISRASTDHAQGATLGLAQSASSLARIVGPLFAGALFEGLGREWPYIAGAVIMIAVIVGSLRLRQAATAKH